MSARPDALSYLPRFFALLAVVFGLVFVLVNAGDLPKPWSGVAMVAGIALAVLALGSGVLRSAPSAAVSGSPRVYWIAVVIEVIAIPVGANVLSRLVGTTDLSVLWVVFVVGAHFLPAKAFGIGRFAELGVVLMLVAVVFAALWLAADVEWAPSAGGVLAGFCLLGFASVPALSRPTRPADRADTEVSA